MGIAEGEAVDAESFEINPESGVITTAVSLDHEQKSIYRVAVLARDGGSPPLQEIRVLRIEVLDLNDNRPAMSSISVTMELKENVPLGFKVGTVSAVDVDIGDSAQMSYAIIGGNLLHVFTVNYTSGALYVSRPVDYEQASVHWLQVKAVGSSNALTSVVSLVNVTIKVEDVNDNAPNFQDDPVVFSVSETVAVGTVVWNFTAVDADSGLNGDVRYALQEISTPIPCELDAVSGSLKLKEPLDYETRNEFTFMVVASDSANSTERLASSATVRLLVEDFNDNSPVFVSRNEVMVPEDKPRGFGILNVVAVDRDSGDNGLVTYTILSGNEDKRFDLNATTGKATNFHFEIFELLRG